MALSLAMMALVEPGDEVLYPDPGFPIYPSFARGLGAKAVPFGLVEKNRFQPDLQEIAAKITGKTSVLIFNSPNNPTGTVFDDQVLEGIAALAIKHDLWILTDEIYARILFNGDYKSIWLLPGMAERTVIIDGFSKSFAMTGWRLGYAVAPVHVIDAMDLLVLNTFTCVAEFTQVAAIEALRDTSNAVDAMVAEYKLRRDLFVQSLAKFLASAAIRPKARSTHGSISKILAFPPSKCRNFCSKKQAWPLLQARPSVPKVETTFVFRWSVLATFSKMLSTAFIECR
jgi:aspartate/methionine/tyrosine aminotransferase